MRTARTAFGLVGALCVATWFAGAPADSSSPVASVLAAAHAGGGAGGAAGPYCAITWGSGPRSGGDLRTPALVRVTTVRGTCWDRTTFEFAGPVDGYSVTYAADLPTEGAGMDLVRYTAGSSHLSVLLRAPATGLRAGTHAVNVVSHRTLRDVVFGGSVKGHSTFAVGVRARLPFRVTVAAGPGSHSRIMVDVAHRW